MKVLFVNGCIRGEDSRTLRLCRTALEEIRKAAPDAQVEELVLDRESDLAPLRSDTLALRGQLEKEETFDHPMFRYARQFARADLVVLGAPYWEYQFPALVRCYLEHVTVGGVTFSYGQEGQISGLCRAQRLLYITTAGGPILDRNCGFDYVKTLCGQMLQIPEIDWAGAECLDVWGEDVEARLARAEEDIRKKILGWKWPEDAKEAHGMSEFKYIITIGREYGAGGRTVAKRLSELLGIPYYDKDIIKITAQETGFSEEMIYDTEESETGRSFFNWFLPTGIANSTDQAIVAQAQTMRNIARKGPCIMVGRAADFVLRDFPNLINVFICAEEEDRIKYAVDTFGDTPEKAAKRVRHVDASRQSFYHYLTKEKWGDLTKYDLTLNSSPIGKEACADVIIAYARAKEAKEGK